MANVVHKYRVPQHFDELVRESNNAIYLCILNSAHDKVDKKYLMKWIKKHLVNYVINYVFGCQEVTPMHTYDEGFERLLVKDTIKDIDEQLDNRQLLRKVASVATTKSAKIYLYSEIYGKDKLQELYRISDKVLKYARWNGKRVFRGS